MSRVTRTTRLCLVGAVLGLLLGGEEAVRKLLQVCFTAPGCGSCRAFSHVLPLLQRRADEKQRAGYALQLSVFEIDTGSNMGLANELEVVDLPALLLYINGEYHRPLQAAPEAESLYMAVVRGTTEPALEPP
mmetsp:Transcript_69978/g.227822  ORF Transcript_69978/g.227822 Transcript_69978/m.227822 type:complete len:132 (-) Transcript_69978:208-603(-)